MQILGWVATFGRRSVVQQGTGETDVNAFTQRMPFGAVPSLCIVHGEPVFQAEAQTRCLGQDRIIHIVIRRGIRQHVRAVAGRRCPGCPSTYGSAEDGCAGRTLPRLVEAILDVASRQPGRRHGGWVRPSIRRCTLGRVTVQQWT